VLSNTTLLFHFHFSFFIFQISSPMKAAHRKSTLQVVVMRERANRLIRRISALVQNYNGDNINDAIIGFCTEQTFADCMFATMLKFLFLYLVQFPGGYLFYFWLLSNGPLVGIQIIKECAQVISLIFYQGIYKIILSLI